MDHSRRYQRAQEILLVSILSLSLAGILTAAPPPSVGSFHLFGSVEWLGLEVDEQMPSESEATSLAAGDVDGDGVPDLVVGYAKADGGGRLAVLRGNLDAIYPYHPGARERKLLGTFSDAPFLAEVRIIELTDAVDFLRVGDVDADGRLDIVTADRKQTRLLVTEGDALPGSAPRQVTLPGHPTALALGEVGRRDARLEFVVAVTSERGAELVLLEDSATGVTAMSARIALPTPAVDLLVRDLVGDGFHDIAAVAGNELLVVRDPEIAGSTTGVPAEAYSIDRRTLTGPGRALVWGNFVLDAHGTLAVLDDLGKVTYFPVEDRVLGPAIASGRSSSGAVGLLGSTYMPREGDRLAAFGPGGLELHRNGPETGKTAPAPRRIALPGIPVAALGMRLDSDAFDDLVIVLEGRWEPVVLRSLKGVTADWIVNSTGNEADTCPGDGICSVGPGDCPAPSAVCTLKAALSEASFAGVPAVIHFDIPGGGPFTITEGVTAWVPVTIDGTSQPGFAGTPIIEIRPADTGQALAVTGSSVVRGLVLTGASLTNSRSGVAAICSNNIVEGNFIGIGTDGITAIPNAVGVHMITSSCGTSILSGNRIGGTTAAAHNVISANTHVGIQIELPPGYINTDTIIQGNYIGTDSSGTVAVGNGDYGIHLSGQTTDAMVGGTAAGAGNVISGTTGPALASSSAGDTTIQGNLIGLDVSGTSALPNGDGVLISISNPGSPLVGGSGAGAANRISGNTGYGIQVQAGAAAPVSVLGNEIGSLGLGNGGPGYVNWSGAGANLIGGTAPGEGNVIAGNSGDGVYGRSGNFFVRGNAIFGNGDLAIDLKDDGATDNDPGDGDVGPNQLQNFPVTTSAIGDGATLQVTGTLDSLASVTYAVDVFASPNCAAGSRGDADRYLGSFDVTTDGLGDGTFDTSVSGVSVHTGDGVSMTATHPSFGTSEISPCLAASVPSEIFVDGFESGDTTAWSAIMPR